MTPEALYAELAKTMPNLPPLANVLNFFIDNNFDEDGISVEVYTKYMVDSVPIVEPNHEVCPDCGTPVTGWRDYSLELDSRMERILHPCGHAHESPVRLA